MTAIADSESKINKARKNTLSTTNVQSGERGRGDKERVLRVKAKDFTRR